MSNKYLVEAIVFLSYVLFAMAWVGGTASMEQIMSAMEVESMADASLLSGAVTIAKIVGTFVAAWLAIKLGVKLAFMASCLLVAVGVFTPLAASYDMLILSRFFMGLGGALMIVYFNPIVMAFFDKEQRSTINGLNAVAFNVGTAVILWSMADINALTGGWKPSLITFSVLSLLLAVVWLLVKFEAPQTSASNDEKQPPVTYTYKDGITDRFNWTYAFCYSGLLAFYICLFTFYPQAGISASKWVIGFGIVGTLAGMVYSAKVKQRIGVIRFSGLIQTLMIIGLSFSSSELVQIVCASVLGFFVFFPITALVTIPHELKNMTPEKITVVFSLFWSLSYLFATAILWLFGYMVDVNNGDYTAAFWLIALVSTTFFIGSFGLPETNPKTTSAQEETCEEA